MADLRRRRRRMERGRKGREV
jgi:hypothetical protein